MTQVDAYAAIVADEGLVVERVPDNDARLRFRYEGDDYEILTYLDDPAYIGISSTFGIPKGVSKTIAIRTANDATMHAKIVKVYVRPDRGITFAAELYVDDPERLRPVFLRMVHGIQKITAEVFGCMLESQGLPGRQSL